jgi:hypothetical protein
MPGKKVIEGIIKRGKPKFILSGKSGVGKTFFMLDFPNPLIIDCEGGAVEPQYERKMKAVGAEYIGKEDGSQDFKTVINELKWYATNKHDRQTLVIDSFSKLYNLTAAIAEEKVGNTYQADKKEAQKPTRQLQLWMDRLDMTIALVCHSKSKWENGQPTGLTTFDGWDKLEYDLNLWIELIQTGKRRDIVVRKSRIEGFVLGNSYPADYDTFAKLYGTEVINKPPEQIVLATVEQVSEAKSLIAFRNISEEDQKKALKKYDVESLEELSTQEIQTIIEKLKEKK